MATDLETLVVRLEAKMRGYEREMQRARNVTARQTQAIEQQFTGLNQKIESIMGRVGSAAASGLARFGGALTAALSVDQIAKFSDEWTNATNKIKATGLDAGATKGAQDAITRIAEDSRTSFGTVADLYARLTRSSKELGATQADVSTATETVAKALKLSGASAAEAESTLVQLGQALQSGALQGDELRSLLENAPVLAQAIAQEFGVAVGELKNLGANGELAANRVFAALVKAAPQVNAAFATTKSTFADMWTGFTNALIGFVGALQGAINASPAYVQSLAEIEARLNAAKLASEGFASAEEKRIQGQNRSQATALTAEIKQTEADIRNLQTTAAAAAQDLDRLGAIGLRTDEKKAGLDLVARALSGTKEETIAAAVELQRLGDASPSFANAFEKLNGIVKALAVARGGMQALNAELSKLGNGPEQPAAQTPWKIDRSKILADENVKEATAESIAKGILDDQLVNSKLDDKAKKVVAKEKELRDLLNKQGIGAPSNLKGVASQIVSNEYAASGGGKGGGGDSAAKKAATEVKHFADELNKTLDPTIEYNRQVDLLFSAMERGLIPAGQMAEAMALIGERTLEAGSKTKDADLGAAFKSMEATINSVGSKFGDTLGDLVTGGKVDFNDLANSIIKDLVRIVTQMLIVKPIIESFQSSLKGGGNPLSWLGNILGGGGADVGGAGLGHRASGGPVQGGTSYMVGEHGPELVSFGRNGTIKPNSVIAKGGLAGGTQISIQTNNYASGAEPKVQHSVDPNGIHKIVVDVLMKDNHQRGPVSQMLSRRGLKRF